MCFVHMLPCHKNNVDNKYFKGKKNIQNNKCKKCEFANSLAYFMFKHYREFTLEICCDIENSEGNEPEAIFVNRSVSNEKIVIEAKSFHQIFQSNKKKDDKNRRQRKYFTDKILDSIGKRVYEDVNKYLTENKIHLTQELSNIFLYGLLLTVYLDAVYDEHNGIKWPVSNSVPDEFLSYKGSNERDLINAISQQVVEYIIQNIIVCLRGDIKEYRSCYKFKIDKFNFAIGKSNRDNPFSIEYIERGSIISDIYPPKEAFRYRINGYFEECKEKFQGYMSSEFRRVLLISNESNYMKEKIIELIQEFEKPNYIDEVWCSFYVTEDIWSDELEDFDGERIVDIEYVKVLE